MCVERQVLRTHGFDGDGLAFFPVRFILKPVSGNDAHKNFFTRRGDPRILRASTTDDLEIAAVWHGHRCGEIHLKQTIRQRYHLNTVFSHHRRESHLAHLLNVFRADESRGCVCVDRFRTAKIRLLFGNDTPSQRIFSYVRRRCVASLDRARSARRSAEHLRFAVHESPRFIRSVRNDWRVRNIDA